MREGRRDEEMWSKNVRCSTCVFSLIKRKKNSSVIGNQCESMEAVEKFDDILLP